MKGYIAAHEVKISSESESKIIYIIFNYLIEQLIRLTVMSQPTEALQVKSRPRINNKIKFN